MKRVSEHIPGYSYGAAEVAKSPVSTQDLEKLKTSAGFTEEDQRYLQLAGEVLTGQTKQIVDHWRSGIIANIPNLARHSRSPEGSLLPEYLAKSNLRFEQWILRQQADRRRVHRQRQIGGGKLNRLVEAV